MQQIGSGKSMKRSDYKMFRNVHKETKEERLNRTECDKIKEQRKREQRRQYNLVRFNKQGKKGRYA